jgi:predicted transcriptional regulator of viral defense system
MKQSKLVQRLRPLLKRPFFSLEDAKKQGVSRQALANVFKKGIINRVSAGLYQAADYEPEVEFQWEHLALIAASIPHGVICWISALCYYDLTDQIMRESWIAVPFNTHPPKRPLTRIIRMRNITLGRTKIKMGEYNVQIFDRERCVVDAFRDLSIEIALKALKIYLRSREHKPQLTKLTDYGEILHVDLMPYILAYTT